MVSLAPDSAPADVGFIVFSDDWGEHPSSSQHLFRQIVQRYPVLWVNTIGMRNPTLSIADLRKVWRKASKMLGGRKAPAAPAAVRPPLLQVSQPFMLPFSGSSFVRRFNRRSVLRAVEALAAKHLPARRIVVSSVPNACDYVRDLGAERVVYYCVDDFTQWPGFEHGLVREMESRLINASDVLVATSRKLQSMLSTHGKPVHLLTHGVDVDLFASEAAAVHPAIASIPSPRVGYFGLIDERSDQQLLGEVIRRMPDISFVFTGPVATSVENLSRYPNAHFTGSLPYAELPSLVKGLSALMLPYLVNDFTASISPLKMKEYLATGRPVIATPMPEAVLQASHVTIAADTEAWVSAIRASLSVDIDARRARMREVLAGESWRDKASAFLQICGSQPGALVRDKEWATEWASKSTSQSTRE